jgi:hypothetical protein
MDQNCKLWNLKDKCMIDYLLVENIGKIAGEESCAGEGACCPEAVYLSDLKTANTVVCFI